MEAATLFQDLVPSDNPTGWFGFGSEPSGNLAFVGIYRGEMGGYRSTSRPPLATP